MPSLSLSTTQDSISATERRLKEAQKELQVKVDRGDVRPADIEKLRDLSNDLLRHRGQEPEEQPGETWAAWLMRHYRSVATGVNSEAEKGKEQSKPGRLRHARYEVFDDTDSDEEAGADETRLICKEKGCSKLAKMEGVCNGCLEKAIDAGISELAAGLRKEGRAA